MTKKLLFLSLALIPALCLTNLITARRPLLTHLNNCTLLTRPTTITKPGYYKLKNNIKVSDGQQFAIKIEAKNVHLDLNNKTLLRQDHKKNNLGILISDAENVVIENGRLANFYDAIVITGSKHITIKRLDLHHVNNIGIILSRVTDAHITHNWITLNSKIKKNDPVDFYLVGINTVTSQQIVLKSNVIKFPNGFRQADNIGLEQVGILLSSNNHHIRSIKNAIYFDWLWQKTIGLWAGQNNNYITITQNDISNAWNGVITDEIKNAYIKYCNITLTLQATRNTGLCEILKQNKNSPPTSITSNQPMHVKILQNKITGYPIKNIC